MLYATGLATSTTVEFSTPTSNHKVLIPARGTTGSPATLISDADTATVTNTMLAGSIALSKLAITGTPDGTKYLRDDGSWQSISLSGYLPLTGGTLTGPLAITGGTVTASASPLSISQTWNNGAVTFAGIDLSITTSAAGASSYVMRYMQNGSTERFKINTDGTTIFNNGACSMDTSNSRTNMASGWYLNWNDDTRLYRDAAHTIQMWADVSTPVAQSFKAHDGSGSNADAASLTLSGGRSTGTGDDGDLIFRTTMTGSSGSSQNSLQTRSHALARFVNLTEGTATNVASIALASGKVTGGTATLTVWASDGTDHQALTSEVRFSAVNKAGTITATTSQTDGTTATSAGTLTVTYDATASGNNLLLRADATSSLTQTTLRCRLVITALNGDDVQTVTPQ
jgi:hypothetical protein